MVVNFRAAKYTVMRHHKWVYMADYPELPLFKGEYETEEDLYYGYCQARLMARNLLDPQADQIVKIKISFLGKPSQEAERAEYVMVSSGLDMLVGEMQNPDMLWDIAAACAESETRREDAKSLYKRLAAQYPFPDWTAVRNAVSLGLTVLGQTQGDEAQVAEEEGNLLYRMAGEQDIEILDIWPTHHLYINTNEYYATKAVTKHLRDKPI